VKNIVVFTEDECDINDDDYDNDDGIVYYLQQYDFSWNTT
jgi:hypothetical protein